MLDILRVVENKLMPKIQKKQRKTLDPMEAIKRLLILIAIQNGADSKDVARVLNIDSSAIRHMISIKKAKKSQEV